MIHPLILLWASVLIQPVIPMQPPLNRRKYVAENFLNVKLDSNIHDSCAVAAVSIEQGSGYAMHQGFCDTSGIHNNTSISLLPAPHLHRTNPRSFSELMSYNLTYVNHEHARLLLEYTFVRSPLRNRTATIGPGGATGCQDGFNAQEFLNLLRNKILVVMGDSIVRQLFEALEVELVPFQIPILRNVGPWMLNGTYNGNGTHAGNENTGFDFISVTSNAANGTGKVKMPVVDLPGKYIHRGKYRHYPGWNASIYWCENPRMELDFKEILSDWNFCGRQSVAFLAAGPQAGYLLIGVGAWFKPDPTATDYETRTKMSAVKLAQDATAYRKLFAAVLPPTVPVLWRLQPHAANRDELIAEARGNITRLRAIPSHNDDERWNGIPEDQDALWPTYFNTVLRAVAAAHGDLVIDQYTLSKTYLRYIYRINRHHHHELHHHHYRLKKNTTQPVVHIDTAPLLRPHIDSLHYHAGGFFRATLVVLQDALQYYDRCHGGSSDRTTS